MRTHPRQHILDIWRAFARTTFATGEWAWGGRVAPNSISDAEQLLVLLRPATEVPGLALHDPDAIDDDVLTALKPLGYATQIPRRLLAAIEEYLVRYTDEDGPIFTGGSYLLPAYPNEEVKPERSGYDITESYAASVTLCLSAKQFLSGFWRTIARRELSARIEAVILALDTRLTAAMTGLIRSFTINVLTPDSAGEQVLLRTVSQGRRVGRTLTQDLRDRLQPVRDKLPELTFGLPEQTREHLLYYPDQFFECGWTWGVVRDAAVIDLPAATRVRQPLGAAEPRPMLHFTVAALDALADLFSSRTAREGLLNVGQLPLREALNLRWNLTLQYWATIATFGPGTWPVEDVPWQTTDGESSLYFSELVLSVLVLAQQGRTADSVVRRGAGVLEDLARRGLVNRRANEGDQGIALHRPGVLMRLAGSGQEGPTLAWLATGYATTLGRTALRLASITTGGKDRERLISTADDTVDHLLARRGEAEGLWDQPDNVFPTYLRRPAEQHTPAWDVTARAVEIFVAAAALTNTPPPTDPDQVGHAKALIAEARHILDQERLTTPTHDGTQVRKLLQESDRSLDRAESLVTERPATASALTEQVLRHLDELTRAREDPDGSA